MKPAAVFVFVVLLGFLLNNCQSASNDRVRRADDVSPIETVVDNLAQQVNDYGARIASLEAQLAKAQTSIAFHAEYSRDPVNLGPAAPIILDRAVTNIGNGYDAGTGNFHAPVSGTYMFVVHFMGDINVYTYIHILVDDTVVDTSISHGDGHTWDHVSESLIVHLEKGQRVWLQRGSEQNIVKAMRGSHWTTFSGFLIKADV